MNWNKKDLRALRLLHEYGFNDRELSEHLGIDVATISAGRAKLALPVRESRTTPPRRKARVVTMKPRDDRVFL